MTVDDYIVNTPSEVQPILLKIRAMILSLAPDVEESIAYMMPGYKTYGKPLIYFGHNKKHLGLYATPSGHSQFEDRLVQYKGGKGSVQFPYNGDIPYDLIEEIIRFRIEENKKLYQKI
jgi:uncharacterized protein YdhG (YjbR/CyaY superfamily)